MNYEAGQYKIILQPSIKLHEINFTKAYFYAMMNESKIVSLNLYISFNVGVCMFLNIYLIVQWLSFFYLMGAPRSDGARISPIKDKLMTISFILCLIFAIFSLIRSKRK